MLFKRQKFSTLLEHVIKNWDLPWQLNGQLGGGSIKPFNYLASLHTNKEKTIYPALFSIFLIVFA